MTTDDGKDALAFFRMLEIDNQELSDHRDAMEQLRKGDCHGILVHNVFDSAVLTNVVEHLEQHDSLFVQTCFPDPFEVGLSVAI